MHIIRTANYDWLVIDDNGVFFGFLDHLGNIVQVGGAGGPGEVTLTGVQTLYNKTLVDPVISGTPTGLEKADVGLGNVDNTADMDKPVSGPQQLALNAKVNVADLATQAEAVAGTNNTKWMSPLRVAQAIAALGGGSGGGSTYFETDYSVTGYVV